MSKFFNVILKILAALCVIAFVFALALSLLLFNAERKLFDAQAYLHALEAQSVYDRLPSLAADIVASSGRNSGDPSYLGLLPAEDLKKAISAVVPPDVTRAITRQTIVSFFDFLDGKTEQAVLPLTEFKTYLAGPQGLEAVQNFLDSQPDCTPEQILDMTLSNIFGDEGSLYLCRPPGDLGDFVLEDLLGIGLQAAAQEIPDQVVLLDTQNPSHAKLVSRLRVARLAMLFSLL
ncbi:MAG: hypothetical protein AB1750_20760, partial [Chloroflexota bacterium]